MRFWAVRLIAFRREESNRNHLSLVSGHLTRAGTRVRCLFLGNIRPRRRVLRVERHYFLGTSNSPPSEANKPEEPTHIATTFHTQPRATTLEYSCKAISHLCAYKSGQVIFSKASVIPTNGH
ncbi:Hypothetical protein NTJ_02248 [Nesidiocoris tenuis]|uniref:Uncharacterized protein n=1 Tax=Nesidiocoris tenuis TaxID=355587 RepID=A0ABN7AAV6_9HEMI|nr:Hypothetical protein NTJ_02248 [Nesidiocoris tenuis]